MPRTYAPQVVGLSVGAYTDVQALWLTSWYYYAHRKPLQA
jgi:hypothetical protein